MHMDFGLRTTRKRCCNMASLSPSSMMLIRETLHDMSNVLLLGKFIDKFGLHILTSINIISYIVSLSSIRTTENLTKKHFSIRWNQHIQLYTLCLWFIQVQLEEERIQDLCAIFMLLTTWVTSLLFYILCYNWRTTGRYSIYFILISRSFII